MKILSTKIKLYYWKGATAPTAADVPGTDEDWVHVNDVTSLPAMGAQPEKVETTTLGNEARQYIKGLKDYGDLEFGFVFNEEKISPSTTPTKTLFEVLKDLEGNEHYFAVTFPAVSSGSLAEDAGLKFYFKGEPTVAMGAAEVGARVDFTMSVALASDIKNTLPL